MAPPEVVSDRSGPGRQAVAWAARLVRFDARRPAAWISLATAGVVTWLVGAAGATADGLVVPVAIGAGGLLAGAALGAPGSGLPDGRRRPWAAAWLMRVAWPISGAFVAAGAGGDEVAAVAVAVAAAVTAAAAFAAVAAGSTEPAATAVGLAVTGAAAAAALVAGFIVPDRTAVQVVAAAAAWGLVAAAAWFACRDDAGWSSAAEADRGESAPGRRWTLAPGMPGSLVGAALITSLVAMVVCYFLVPAFDGLYAAVAGGWFLCLAVPPATIGVGGTLGRRLARTAPGRPAVPGSVRRGLTASAPILVVLGWPAAVALVLPAADGSRSGGPLAAIIVLVGGGLLLVAALALGGHRNGELARATVLAAAAAVLGGLPGLPRLPGPAGEAGARSVLSPGSDPARLPEHRIRLELPHVPGGSAVNVENSLPGAR